MPAAVPVVSIYSGDTVTWPTYTIKNSGGTAIDLVAAGWSQWVAEWRATDTADTAIVLTVDTSRANEGILIISASPTSTRAMGGPGVWDIQATGTNGVIKTWLRGKTKWSEDVTRA